MPMPPEKPVEVTIRHPRPRRAADHAEKNVEDRIERSVADRESHEGEECFDHFPPDSPDEPDHRPRNNRMPGRVEKHVVAPGSINNLRDYSHENERRREMRDLIIERHRLEEAPYEASRIQNHTENYERYDPPTRHPYLRIEPSPPPYPANPHPKPPSKAIAILFD